MKNMDLVAYDFVERVSGMRRPTNAYSKPTSELRGAGTNVIGSLGEVSDFVLCQFDPVSGDKVNYFKTIGGKAMGLDESDYGAFSEVVQELMETEQFIGRSDFSFLMECACEWLLGVFQHGYSKTDLTVHLLNRIEEDTRSYTFSFRMDGLQIDKDFLIGHTRFSVIDETQAKDYCGGIKTDVGNPVDDDLWKSFAHQFAVVGVRSTFERAKQVGLREAELSVDVLKCFCYLHSLNPLHILPDLAHRNGGVRHLNYWFYPEDNFHSPGIKMELRSGIVPVQLDERFLDHACKLGLNVVSDFITHQYSDPLYTEIIDTIKRFSDVVSTGGNHEMIVKIISLLEGPLSPRPHTGSNKGERITKMAAHKLNEREAENFETAISHGYRVRNAFVHNCQQIPIDRRHLQMLLEIVRIFLLRLMELHRKGKRSFEDIELYFLGEDWVTRRHGGKK